MTEHVKNLGNVYYYDLDRIHHNPLNDEIYGIAEDISQIKQNLLINGLQSPLEVVKEENEGEEPSYRLLSGHGRYDSLLELNQENQTVLYQGKTLGSKVPCLLHPQFKDINDELEYLLGGNVRKNRDKESIKRAALKANEIYELKKVNGELQEGETKRKYISNRVGISERSVDKYIKELDKNTTSSNKIQSVTTVLKELDKIEQIINEIQMDEYGKTDRNSIIKKYDDVVETIKRKKKEK